MIAVPQSIAETEALLAGGNYVADRALATTLFLSLKMGRPLFLEGEAGVGKTEIAKVLATGLDRKLIRLQCYEGLDVSSAVYEWNYSRQMIEIRLAEAAGTVEKEKLAGNLFSEEFLIERPLLESLRDDQRGPPVLLIDELDRTDEPFEAFLLEILSDFQISIPEIGTIAAKQPPLVIITSNRTREIHDALKRRCLYHWVDYPDFDREMEIISSRAPEAAENLSREMKVTNTSAKTALVTPLGDHLLTVGANFEKEELSDQTSNQISNRTEVDASKWALFAEDEWMLPGNVSVTGGVRLDDDENYGSHVSPRLYGVWGMAPRWTLKGGVSTGFRSPSLREITPDWGQVSRGGDVYGNPDLEPETSVNKELGLYFNAGRDLQANVTVFHNDFKDKITRIACPPSVCPGGPNQFGSDPTYRVNVDEAVTRGVEAAVSTTLARTLDLTLSYTYTDSEQQSGEYEGEPLNQVPKHLASLQADWRVTSRLSPWLAVRYRGEESQPTTGPSSSSIVAPSNTLVDAGLAFKLTPQATLNTGIYNIADKEIFQDEYGYVEDGRRYWLGMRVSF